MAENPAIQEENVITQNASAQPPANNRRYVGSKETAAYVVYDICQSFNISKYSDVFITDSGLGYILSLIYWLLPIIFAGTMRVV